LKLGDIVEHITIDPRKLTHYALDPDSPRGQHKALLFERLLGYTRANYLDLLRQLEQHCWETNAVFESEDNFGKRYRVDLDIEGSARQQVTVRTVWLVPVIEKSTAQLITLYVRKR